MELVFSRNLPEQSNIDRKQFIIGGDGLEMKTNLKVDRAPAPQLPIEKVAEHSGREECHRRGCAARQRHRGFFAIGSGWRRRQPCGELGHDRCGLQAPAVGRRGDCCEVRLLVQLCELLCNVTVVVIVAAPKRVL